jgi:hypothetical protein
VRVLPSTRYRPRVVKTILYITRDSEAYWAGGSGAVLPPEYWARAQLVKKWSARSKFAAGLFPVDDVYAYVDEWPRAAAAYLKTALRSGLRRRRLRALYPTTNDRDLPRGERRASSAPRGDRWGDVRPVHFSDDRSATARRGRALRGGRQPASGRGFEFGRWRRLCFTKARSNARRTR